MKSNLILGVILALGLLITLGLSPFFVVDLTETAIVVALGKPVRTITEPGLKFKIPFYHQVTFFDKRFLDYDAPSRDVITSDKKSLVIDNFAKWRRSVEATVEANLVIGRMMST